MGFGIIFSLGRTFIVKNLQYWREILILVFGLLLLYQNFSDTRFLFFLDTIPSIEKRYDDVKRDLVKKKQDLKACKVGNKKLSNAIDDRNKEIDGWKDITTNLEKRNKKIENQIHTIKQSYEAKMDDILNSPTPKTCASSIEYLRKSAKELTWVK